MKKYSSGSFIDAAVRVYGSEADTISSFPATIYADGESASALIKGNLQQSGTPTAAAPITPTECGDLSSDKYVIPFQSGNTTTTIDLSAVSTTRIIKKVIFNGEEEWGKTSTNRMRVALPSSPYKDVTCICSHYQGTTKITISSIDNGECTVCTNAYDFVLYDENYTDADSYKTFLAAQYAANTPVTLWYVITSASVGVLNEPLRKIGDNVDSVSATVPTLATAESITVNTTLKPSALQLTYTGWHTHDDKKRSGGAWT